MSFCPTIIHLLNQSSLACAEPESCIDDTGACTAQDAGSSSGLAKTSLLSIISFDVAPGATYRISLSSYDAISQTQSFQLDVSWSPQGPLLDRRRLRALPQDEPPLWTKKDNKLPDIYRGLVDEDPPPSLVDFDVDFTVKLYVDETNTALVQSAIYEKLEYLFAENTTLTAANGGLYRTNFDVLLSEAATTL
jgi:hypothetical protein